MAANAFILIKTKVGKTKEVVANLSKMGEIKSVDAVTGLYDVITVVEQDDFNAIGNLVIKSIHSIDGVIRTVTCLSIRIS